MKQPLYPLNLQAVKDGVTQQPVPSSTVGWPDTGPVLFTDWGVGRFRELISNGFTFSYQEWTVREAVTALFGSPGGGMILHFSIAGKLGFSRSDLVAEYLTEAVYGIGFHPGGAAQAVGFEVGNYRYLQIALSPPLASHLIHGLTDSLPGEVYGTQEEWFYQSPLPLSKSARSLLPVLIQELLREKPDLFLLNQWGLQLLTRLRSDAKRWQRHRLWEAKKELRIEDLHNYIDDHLDTEDRPLMRVERFARMLRMSRSAFVSLFRRRYGYSPAVYVRLRRLETALQLLRQGRKPGEIYGTVGFEDFAAFTKSFTRHYGFPPSRYRQITNGEKDK